jgi:hypothetical protein
VDQDIAEARQRSNAPGKVRGNDSQLTHTQQCAIVVYRLTSPKQTDDAIAYVDAALSRDLQVALHDITEVGILVERASRFLAERLQPGQAFAQFVQAPLDTGELCGHARLLPESRRVAREARGGSHRTG